MAQFRRMMVAAVQKFQQGSPAIGTPGWSKEPLPSQVKLASFEGVVPKSTDWRTLGVPTGESVTAK